MMFSCNPFRIALIRISVSLSYGVTGIRILFETPHSLANSLRSADFFLLAEVIQGFQRFVVKSDSDLNRLKGVCGASHFFCHQSVTSFLHTKI